VAYLQAKKQVPDQPLSTSTQGWQKLYNGFVSRYSRDKNQSFEKTALLGDVLYLNSDLNVNYEKFQFITVEDVAVYRAFYANRSPKAAIDRKLASSLGIADDLLVELIKLSDNRPQIAQLQQRFVQNAQSMRELQERTRQYPGLAAAEVQKMAAPFVKTFHDFELYQKWLGKTPFDTDLIRQIGPSCRLSELKQLRAAYPNAIDYQALARQQVKDFHSLEAFWNEWKTTPHDAKLIIQIESTLTFDQLMRLKDRYTAPDPAQAIEYATANHIYRAETNVINLLKRFQEAFPNTKQIIRRGQYNYLGVFNGRYDGQGMVWHQNLSAAYRGQFTNGILNDPTGQIYFRNGVEYKGQVVEGKPHGQGIGYGRMLNNFVPECEGGGRYEGPWKNGLPDGYGKYYDCKDELWYEGYFKDGGFHGQGTLRLPSRIRATGEYAEGKPKGLMKLEIWTLMGIISEKRNGEANSWDELFTLEAKLSGTWNEGWEAARRQVETDKQEKARKMVGEIKAVAVYTKSDSESGCPCEQYTIKEIPRGLADYIFNQGTDLTVETQKNGDFKGRWKWTFGSDESGWFTNANDAMADFARKKLIR
jgi:hypothetical protein